MNKRGLIPQIISILAIVLILILVIVGIYTVGLALPIGVSVVNDVNTALQDAMPTDYNASNHSQTVIGNTVTAINNFEWISWTLIIGSLLVFLFIAFFIREYPFLFVFWIGFMIVLIFSTIWLSIAYQDLANSNDYVGIALRSWEGNDFIMRYLPHIFTAIGFIQGVILFALLSREQEAEIGI